MRLYPEKLAAHLKQQCLPVYLVSGDETLLVQECADQVRAAARAAGCTERELIEVAGKDFDWQVLLNSAADMSLFGDRKLIELRIPSGKPGADGSKAICEYLERSSGDDILLLVLGKIDKSSQNSKWFKAIDAAGAWLQVWEVKAQELPRWLQQRIEGAGMTADRDALQLLADRVEGNLLAAVQEVEKLKLLAPDNHISAETVTSAVADNARFNLFAMVDCALQGDAAGSLRMLHGLRGEGTDATVALWALAREIRSLYELQAQCQRGPSQQQVLQQAVKQRKLWQNRLPMVQSALGRHDLDALGELLQLAAAVDGSIKGYARGNTWNQLDNLVTALSGTRTGSLAGAGR
ncbi:DNA polymerase III subunit delta [Parahaliea aestuarii]|uniref:DNA polymerase III subunit delta n=1 Tax=Parahaliea aestuarii TaxID=1852021 RepID=A0A5C8ZQQ5_9GAMM|nr:DNA polymerase III subunit delta [Parahaliea aestuarii]TXS89990.1 DNA polymerase III subunit delta [Parahaliea aestuarii]